MSLPAPTADPRDDIDAHRIAEVIWSEIAPRSQRSEFLVQLVRGMGELTRAGWATRAGVDVPTDEAWERVCDNLARHQRALLRPKASP